MRSYLCGSLREANVGEDISLCGWVHRRRDHGGVIFLDLRDYSGIVQVVYDPDSAVAFSVADSCRNEFVVQIFGRVRSRDDAAVNENMETGFILKEFFERTIDNNNYESRSSNKFNSNDFIS